MAAGRGYPEEKCGKNERAIKHGSDFGPGRSVASKKARALGS